MNDPQGSSTAHTNTWLCLGVVLCWKRRLCCPYATAEWQCKLEITKIFAPAARILLPPAAGARCAAGGNSLQMQRTRERCPGVNRRTALNPL